VLPNGERIPDLLVERLLPSGTCCWSKTLVEVEDDLESRYLAAQRSKLEFALTVPNHGACCLLLACADGDALEPVLTACMRRAIYAAAGRVEGVLWYFPYENDQESVPLDPHTTGRMLLMSNRAEGGPTQNPAAAAALTQRGGGVSQMPAWQSQRLPVGTAAGQEGGSRQPMEMDATELEAAGRRGPGWAMWLAASAPGPSVCKQLADVHTRPHHRLPSCCRHECAARGLPHV
jgi:hypothetical protein